MSRRSSSKCSTSSCSSIGSSTPIRTPETSFVQRGPEGQARIVVLDLGSATPLRQNLADGMFDILQGLMTRKDDLVVQGIDAMGFMAADGDRELLERNHAQVLREAPQPEHLGLLEARSQHRRPARGSEMKREELRELMRSIAYPEGWFYVERAAVIMFGLQAQLAPKLNGIQVGFPYVMQFMMERNKARMDAAAAKPAAPKSDTAEPAKDPAAPGSDEALLN